MFSAILMAAALAASSSAALDCRDARAVQAAWQDLAQTYDGKDKPAARAKADGIIAACGQARATWLPRIIRADIALGEQDFAGAYAAIEPVPAYGQGANGSYAAYLRLRALAGLKREAEFAETRQGLVSAAAEALTNRRGAIRGREIERFQTSFGEVRAFQANLTQGQFVRSYVFLITPKAPLELPQSVMLTSNQMVNQIAARQKAPAPSFVDAYDCGGHTTITMLPKTPDYAALKKVVIDFYEGRAAATSSTRPNGQVVCANPAFVTPGLDVMG